MDKNCIKFFHSKSIALKIEAQRRPPDEIAGRFACEPQTVSSNILNPYENVKEPRSIESSSNRYSRVAPESIVDGSLSKQKRHFDCAAHFNDRLRISVVFAGVSNSATFPQERHDSSCVYPPDRIQLSCAVTASNSLCVRHEPLRTRSLAPAKRAFRRRRKPSVRAFPTAHMSARKHNSIRYLGEAN
jgi:hypothetical protein